MDTAISLFPLGVTTPTTVTASPLFKNAYEVWSSLVRSTLKPPPPTSLAPCRQDRPYSPRKVGSSTSRSQSPVRLITMEVIMRTTPGQVEIHQAESR